MEPRVTTKSFLQQHNTIYFAWLAVRHITRQDIHFVRELGEGAFGRVFLGLCKGIQPGEEHTMVAVKTVKV